MPRELTDQEAEDLATICKRITWREARDMAGSDEEAYRFIDATNTMREILQEQGVLPR